MKIWLVTNMYPSSSNSNYGIFVKKVSDGLEKIETVSIKRTTVIYHKLIIFKVINYLSFYFNQLIFGIFGLYNILYIHFPKRSAFPSILIAKIRKKPAILNFHGTDIIGGKVTQFINQQAINLATSIIVPSKSFKQIIINNYKTSEEKIIVSPSGGISDNFFTLKKYDPAGSIGYVSRIELEKGWKILLDAYNKCESKIPSLEYYGSGSGVLDLQGRISSKNSIYYKGTKSHTDLPNIYSQFSLFIFPSKRESLGLVGLEAMASGIPVIGSSIDGIKSYLKDGYNGFLFKTEDKNDLSDKIDIFFQLSIEKKVEMSKNAIITASGYKSSNVINELFILLNTLNKN